MVIGAMSCGHHVIPFPPFPFFISTSVPERPSWTFEPEGAVPRSGQAWPHSNSLAFRKPLEISRWQDLEIH